MTVVVERVEFRRNHLSDLELPGMWPLMYDAVPTFLYVLAQNQGVGFLTDAQRIQVEACDFIQYTNCTPEYFAQRTEALMVVPKHAWKGTNPTTGEPIAPERLRELRNLYRMDQVRKILELEHIRPYDVDYLGFLPPAEGDYGTHVLTSRNKTVHIVQDNPPNDEFRILTIAPRTIQILAHEIVAAYPHGGVCGSLKSFLRT